MQNSQSWVCRLYWHWYMRNTCNSNEPAYRSDGQLLWGYSWMSSKPLLKARVIYIILCLTTICNGWHATTSPDSNNMEVILNSPIIYCERAKIQHNSNKPFQPSEGFLTFFLNGFGAVCSGKHWVFLQSAPYSVLTIDIKITLLLLLHYQMYKMSICTTQHIMEKVGI